LLSGARTSRRRKPSEVRWPARLRAQIARS
jgi:hypothetical protein